ncbi:hypothetical protein J31TS4_22250 [Paenibacillus sp. J31TS4]|nr:hypothetical protein J31TS4_22250 [Paenibacillus sp. J31TS4]
MKIGVCLERTDRSQSERIRFEWREQPDGPAGTGTYPLGVATNHYEDRGMHL